MADHFWAVFFVASLAHLKQEAVLIKPQRMNCKLGYELGSTYRARLDCHSQVARMLQQVKIEEVNNSSNKILQTWERRISQVQYVLPMPT